MTPQETTAEFQAAFDRATQAAELAARIDHIHRAIDAAIGQKSDTLEESLAALFAAHETALRTITDMHTKVDLSTSCNTPGLEEAIDCLLGKLKDERVKATSFLAGATDGVPG